MIAYLKTNRNIEFVVVDTLSRTACNQPYVPLEILERETDKHYVRVKLTDEFREAVATEVDAALLDELATEQAQQKRITAPTQGG